MKSPVFSKPVYVTKALVPPFDSFAQKLKGIFSSRVLTNQGENEQALEKAVAAYLGVNDAAVFCNGTMALQLAISAFQLSGEIITTPFTFPATVHVLRWNNIAPVFCDIDPNTFNLDPNCLEKLITPKTTAIIPVHIYGMPCDIEAIETIAKQHGLKVIYDAAHAFGVKRGETSVAQYGDASMYSFHATKVFTTVEGGALVARDSEVLNRVRFLRNFGFRSEEEVVGVGINGKMNEIQAAFGLEVLKLVDNEISLRNTRIQRYKERLSKIPGIKFQNVPPDVSSNSQYMPILITEEFGSSRDDLYAYFKQHNVHCRKYFYPLCSNFSIYKQLPSSNPSALSVANRISNQVLCLPLYGELSLESVDKICELVEDHQLVGMNN